MTTVVLLTILAAGPADVVPLERLGRLDHPAIREASGIVQSRRHPGVFWVHNDSGNPTKLFAVRRDGTFLREYAVNVPNLDWEDIATDNAGHLYIGDIGNNDNRLPLRAVYQFDEPDPALAPPRFLKARTASYYRFPATGRFDAEGLVVDGGRALVVAKTFDGRDAEVYAVPMEPPAPLIRPAVAARVGTLRGFTRPVTGADLSADGLRLVVCSVDAAGVYAKARDGGWTPLWLGTFHAPGEQVEAVAWDGEAIVLAGEGRGVFRIAAGAWKARPGGRRGRETAPHGR